MMTVSNQFRDNVPITVETSQFVQGENPLTGFCMLRDWPTMAQNCNCATFIAYLNSIKNCLPSIIILYRRSTSSNCSKYHFLWKILGNRKKPTAKKIKLLKNSISLLMHFWVCYGYLPIKYLQKHVLTAAFKFWLL